MIDWVDWAGDPWKVSGAGGDIMVDLGGEIFVAEGVVGWVTVTLVDGRVVTNRDDVVFVEAAR